MWVGLEAAFDLRVELGQLAPQRLQRGHDPVHHSSGDGLAVHPRLLGVRGRLGPRSVLGRHPDVVRLQPRDQIGVADLPQRGGSGEAAEQGQRALGLANVQRAFQRGKYSASCSRSRFTSRVWSAPTSARR